MEDTVAQYAPIRKQIMEEAQRHKIELLVRFPIPNHVELPDLDQNTYEKIRELYWVPRELNIMYCNWFNWKIGCKPKDTATINWGRPTYEEANMRNKVCKYLGNDVLPLILVKIKSYTNYKIF